MDNDSSSFSYTLQVAHHYRIGEYQFIPYNHWCEDIEWIVKVKNKKQEVLFVNVDARDPQEACTKAFYLLCSSHDYLWDD